MTEKDWDTLIAEATAMREADEAELTAKEARDRGEVWIGGYDIAPLLAKARAEEREACAKVAEEWADRMGLDSTRDVVRTVAAAIRKRDTT